MLEPAIVYRAYHMEGPAWRRSILREYLQLKALQYLYRTAAGARLVFMGGTAIHFLAGSPRFSEDLDFDNRGLGAADFRTLADGMTRDFALENVACTASVKERQGMTAVFRFTGILQQWGLTGHRDEVLHIKMDAQPQEFDVVPDRHVLDRLDVFVPVPAIPVSVLLAQKFSALLGRPRTMGRDIYDIAWLLGQTKPDYAYLQAKDGIPDAEHLRQAVLDKLVSLDLIALRADVLPFLPNQHDADRITFFGDLMRSVEL